MAVPSIFGESDDADHAARTTPAKERKRAIPAHHLFGAALLPEGYRAPTDATLDKA